MSRTIHTTKEPVTLEGFQAVLKPSQYGYKLGAVIDQKLVDTLEDERIESLKWAESKLKNPKRATLKAEPWEEVSNGKYRVKFSWGEDKKPPIVDTEGQPITDLTTPVYEGSKVKVGFYQKPYILRDGVTYGTSLKLVGVQIVSVKTEAGVDSGDLNEDEVADLFGTCSGFKGGEPNVTATTDDEEEDF